MTNLPESSLDWVAAYNDLHWLLTMERAAKTLGFEPALTKLLTDLYAEQKQRGGGYRG